MYISFASSLAVKIKPENDALNKRITNTIQDVLIEKQPITLLLIVDLDVISDNYLT